ncbi:MAG: hypothetical protein ABMA26_16530 [Limisphaerales bacterium]
MTTNHNSPRINLLLVDAEHDYFAMVMLLLEEIAPRRFLLQWASTYGFAVSMIRRHQFALCFSNVRIGHRTGTDLLLDMRARGCMTPVIFLASGEEMMDSGAVHAMDYLDRNRLSGEMLRQALRDAGFRPGGVVPGVAMHPELASPLASGMVRVAA